MEAIESVRGKLSALAGTPLEDAELVHLLAEIVGGGCGVHIEVDESTRYKLIRRDGKFMLSKDSPRRSSAAPPRR